MLTIPSNWCSNIILNNYLQIIKAYISGYMVIMCNWLHIAHSSIIIYFYKMVDLFAFYQE